MLAATALVALSACGPQDDPAEVAVDHGRAVFANSCAACHGSELQGTVAGPPLVHQIYEPGHHPDESFRRAISQGVGAHHWDFGPMPPVPDLSDDDIASVIAYVRQQQRSAGIG